MREVVGMGVALRQGVGITAALAYLRRGSGTVRSSPIDKADSAA